MLPFRQQIRGMNQGRQCSSWQRNTRQPLGPPAAWPASGPWGGDGDVESPGADVVSTSPASSPSSGFWSASKCSISKHSWQQKREACGQQSGKEGKAVVFRRLDVGGTPHSVPQARRARTRLGATQMHNNPPTGHVAPFHM